MSQHRQFVDNLSRSLMAALQTSPSTTQCRCAPPKGPHFLKTLPRTVHKQPQIKYPTRKPAFFTVSTSQKQEKLRKVTGGSVVFGRGPWFLRTFFQRFVPCAPNDGEGSMKDTQVRQAIISLETFIVGLNFAVHQWNASHAAILCNRSAHTRMATGFSARSGRFQLGALFFCFCQIYKSKRDE